MKSSKSIIWGAGLLVLLLLALNVYVFLEREWESSFYPTSYATLYYPLDIPTIRSWTVVDRDHLQLNLACTRSITEWQVLSDGAEPQKATGMTPSFRIDTTFSVPHTYRLVPVPAHACQPIEITTRFYSKEFYGSLGMKHTDVYIVRANVPCGEFDQLPLADWIDTYAYVGEKGLTETDRLLREEAGIGQDDPTFTRMEKVTRFLRIKLINARGVPKDDERWMNPWDLYNDMVYGTGKGWCTQHAQLYVYWANRAGIPTRFVFGARTQDNTIVYTGHAFAESFIREQNRWAFVDLSHANIYITDKNGLVLNTAELFHLNQHNAFDSTTARVYVDWEWQQSLGVPKRGHPRERPVCALQQCGTRRVYLPFDIQIPPPAQRRGCARDLYGVHKRQACSQGTFERYLFKPQLAYSLYPTEGADTYLLRRTLFFALLAALVLWFILSLRRKKAS